MSKKNDKAQQEDPQNETVNTVEDPQTEAPQNTDSQSDSSGSDLDKVKQERDEIRDKYLRMMAEFENFKKRNVRERMELLNTAAQDTLTALLPVIDDFDRALNLTEEQRNSPAFQDGIQLVYQKLTNTLKQRGLEVMDTNGQDFDPELHEALTEIPAPTADLKGKIVDTIERGYTLKGKIIRHAKVVTGK